MSNYNEQNFFTVYFARGFDVSQHYSVDEQEVVKRYHSIVADTFDYSCFGKMPRNEALDINIIISNLLKQITAQSVAHAKTEILKIFFETKEVMQMLLDICDQQLAAEPKVNYPDIRFCNLLDSIFVRKSCIRLVGEELIGLAEVILQKRFRDLKSQEQITVVIQEGAI